MNALERALAGGVEVTNPAYNSKTKKGRLQPKTIIDPDYKKDEVLQLVKGINRNTRPLQYNLNEYVDDNFAEYDVFANPIDDRATLEKERARNQSALEQTGNAIVQAVGSEIALGIMRGYADMVDIASTPFQALYSKIQGEDFKQDWTNPVSSQIEEWQNKLREEYAIYQENPDDALDISWAWAMSNIPSIATTVSLLVPARTISGAAGMISKATGLNRYTSKIGSTFRAAAADKLAKTGQKFGLKALENKAAVNEVTKGMQQVFGTGALMRTQENFMEARESYKTNYDNTIHAIDNMSDKQFADFINKNPGYKGMSKEDIAHEIAGDEALDVFINDYALLGLDMLQLYGLRDMWKGVGRKSSTGRLNRANTTAAQTLGKTQSQIDELAPKGFRKFSNKLIDPFRSAGSVAYAELSEGFEEGFQTINSKLQEEDVKSKLDPTYRKQTISDFLTDDEVLNSAFWGWLGGVAFQAAGSGLGRLSQKLAGTTQATEKNARTQEIENRASQFEGLKQALDKLDKGIPLNVDETDLSKFDPVTGEIIDKMTDSEIAYQKDKIITGFARELALGANRVGNAGLLESYIEDPNIEHYINELYGNQDSANILNKVKQEIKHTNELYSYHINRLDKLGKEDPFIKSVVAELATRGEQDLKNIDDAIIDVQNQINIELAEFNKNGYNVIIDDQLKRLYKILEVNSNLNNETNGLNKQLKDIEAAAKSGSITDIEAKLKTQSLNKQIKELLDYVDESFNGDQTLFDTAYQEAITTNGQNLQTIGNKALRENIFLLNNLERTAAKQKKDLIKEDKDYNKVYKEVENNFKTKKKDSIEESKKTVLDIMDKNDSDIVASYLYGKDTDQLSASDKQELDNAKIFLDINDIDKGLDNYNTIEQLNKFAKNIKSAREKEAAKVTTKEGNNTTVSQKENEKVIVPDNNDIETETSDQTRPPVGDGANPVSTTEKPPVPTSVIPDDSGTIIDIPIPKEDMIIAQQSDIDSETPTADELKAVEFILEEDINKDPGIEASNKLLDKVRSYSDKQEFLNESESIKLELINQLHEEGFGDINNLVPIVNKQYDSIAKAVRRKLTNKNLLSIISGNALDEETIEAFNELLDEYVKKGRAKQAKNGKYYFNAVDFFNYLKEEDISIELLHILYNNIRDILDSSYKNKYIVRNLSKIKNNDIVNYIIENDKTETTVYDNINVALPGPKDIEDIDNFNKVFSKLKPGDYITIIAKENNQGRRFIQYYYGKQQIGYSAIFDKTAEGDAFVVGTYGLFRKANDKNDPLFDILFNLMFNNSNQEEATDIFTLIQDYYNGNVTASIIDLLNHEAIKKHIEEIRGHGFKGANNDQALKNLLNILAPILNYSNAVTNDDYMRSYKQWLKKTYDNYTASEDLYNRAKNKENISVKISRINKGELNTTDEHKALNSNNVDLTNAQLAYVDANGQITLPTENSKDERLGFKRGNVMLMIPNGTNGRIYVNAARRKFDFNDKGEVSNIKQQAIYDNLKLEFFRLFNDRLDNKITFDDLFIHLAGLFGGNLNGANLKDSGQLFDGFRITRKSTTDKNGTLNESINIHHKINGKETIIASFYRYRKGSNTTSNAITILNTKGKYVTINRGKAFSEGVEYKLSNDDANKFINNLFAYMVKNITFSQPMSMLDTLNPNIKDKEISPYVKIKDGKFVLNIGGNEVIFDNYMNYVTRYDAYGVQMTKNSDDSNFTEAYTDGYGNVHHTGNLSININTVQQGKVAEQTLTHDQKVKRLRNSKSVEELLKNLDVSEENIEKLKELYLIPDSFKKGNSNILFGEYNKNTDEIILHEKYFKDAVINNVSNGVRTIIHERIHQLLYKNNINLADFIEDIDSIKQEFIDYVKNEVKDPIQKQTLEKFYFDDNYIKRLSPGLRNNYKEHPEYLIEEFFIEAITNPFLSKALNNIVSKIENKNNTKEKTLWQKIIDLLLKLISGIDNINKDSLLRRVYDVAGNIPEIGAIVSTPVGDGATQDGDQDTSSTGDQIEAPQIETQENEVTDEITNKQKSLDEVVDSFNAENDNTEEEGFDYNSFLDNVEDDNNLASVISGTTIEENAYPNVFDLMRHTDVINETEFVASEAAQSINFSC